MRIGLNLLFLLPSVVGGTETYSRSLIKTMLDQDQSNQFVLFLNRESKDLDFPKREGIKTIVCPVRSSNRLYRFLWEQLVLPWQALGLGIDILHSLGYISPLVLPCKSVVTIHDLNFLAIPEVFSTFTRAIQKFFVTKSARRADQIIVVSEFVQNHLRDYLKSSVKKTTVIYEAPKIIQQLPTELVLWNGIKEKYTLTKPYLFAFSSIAPHKNIARLIHAYAKIRKDGFDCQLVIAGHQSAKGPSLFSLVSDTGLKNNEVIFTGYLPDSEIQLLLAYATVFVFPSLYEGFGLPILEAMAAGVVVACSNRASIPEIAGNAAAYFDPLDINDIASTIVQLLANTHKREALKACAFENLKRFSWQKAAEQTLDVYYHTCCQS